MSEISYRIKIVNGDKQFEVEGDPDFILDMMKRFNVEDIDLVKKAPRSKKEPIPVVGDKSISVSEFIRSFDFRKHTDLVLAFAYYLEKFAGISEFAASDINNLYYEAKRESSNTSQMIISNIRRGFMMEAKEQKSKAKKRYTLTRSGEEHIEKELSKQN